ncbi:MAG TPA: hypothetical protein VK654_06055, partial [Nitrospirota bacterium]|nr:hypothetical protein [Nitrospirota bacterium]
LRISSSCTFTPSPSEMYQHRVYRNVNESDELRDAGGESLFHTDSKTEKLYSFPRKNQAIS